MRPLSARHAARSAALATAIALSLPASAAASTITVSTTEDQLNADPAACSLREAIWAANHDSVAQAPGCVAGGGVDAVAVPAGTYGLTRQGAGENADLTGDLDVTAPATIEHFGPGSTVVDANGIDRAFETSAAGGVTLSGLTIEGGHAAGLGTDDEARSGGGIRNSGGLLIVVGSTLTGNFADAFGGGVESVAGSTTQLLDSTVSANQAVSDGGGIDNTNAKTSLLDVTVSANVADADGDGGGNGGGIGNFGGSGTTSLHNSLIAANVDRGGEAPDCFSAMGVLASQGQTLLGTASGCSFVGGPGDVAGVGPKLGRLADNGGPTPTHALLRDSPAIARGGGCEATDQRGVPRSLGGGCDIGAYELVRCAGRAANRIGTGGPDTLTGTAGRDVFLLFGGNDRAFGLGGADLFCGGAGNDRLDGGSSRDRIFGMAGRDRLKGGVGRDRLIGGAGRDVCNGGAGHRDKASSCERARKIP